MIDPQTRTAKRIQVYSEYIYFHENNVKIIIVNNFTGTVEHETWQVDTSNACINKTSSV